MHRYTIIDNVKCKKIQLIRCFIAIAIKCENRVAFLASLVLIPNQNHAHSNVEHCKYMHMTHHITSSSLYNNRWYETPQWYPVNQSVSRSVSQSVNWLVNRSVDRSRLGFAFRKIALSTLNNCMYSTMIYLVNLPTYPAPCPSTSYSSPLICKSSLLLSHYLFSSLCYITSKRNKLFTCIKIVCMSNDNII